MLDLDKIIGRTIGDSITIVAKLGEGGMGVVFRGLALDGTSVAVKILQPSLVAEPVLQARFEREAVMAAQIDHPNVVRALGHGTEEGVPYIVMELVEGRELFNVLAECRRLAPARAATIAAQICDAVATAHDRGIIHRDLKPENVMLVGDPEGPGGEQVKLLDFGVAKRCGNALCDDSKSITVAGAIVGTPAYMSPEQCLGEAVDARSDVYACGAVLYHLVTGSAPFEDEHAMQTLFRHVHEEPRLPSEFVPDLDPGLEATILKALRKRPEERHQGAHELWEELLAVLPRLLRQEGAPVPAAQRPAVPAMRGPTWALPGHPKPAQTPGTLRSSARRRTPRRGAGTARVRRWAPILVGAAAAACAALGLLGWIDGSLARMPRISPSSPDAASPASTYISADIMP